MSCNVAGVSFNVASVSYNVAHVSCNVAHVSCNVAGVSCNVSRGTCDIARVSRTLLLQDAPRLSITRYYCVETAKLPIKLLHSSQSSSFAVVVVVV